ncbi:type II secretion system protein [Hydrogenimonas urashimensis]|uniref:type II secretion system protein n=1 Tax=Hydrogenimonas urashimensis TaxID=2740515 RepID=UPI0019162FA2|nr:prepilin-type N-terminal cleavage/methylation domain-containing protein [Hydrogenimonas urashimensis]
MMKRGFTLIELIFVIIVIGILAGVALPKLQHMKQNAEVTSVFKIVQDALSSVPPAYINLMDLNGTEARISEIYEIKGSPYWRIDRNYNASSDAWLYISPQGDLNATITIDHSLNPPVLFTRIDVEYNANNPKYQKMKRLVAPFDNTFDGHYTVTIELQ